MKNFIIRSIAAVFLLLFFIAVQAGAQDLVFTIKLDKSVYNKGEPVTCTLLLKNISRNSLVINNRFLVNVPAGPHDVSFQITGPDMNAVPFTAKIKAAFESNDYTILAPGKTESVNYLLSKRFDLSKTGEYKLMAFYENKYDAPAALHMPPAWKGSLHSNSIVLNIR